jgi:hypothetical protein
VEGVGDPGSLYTNPTNADLPRRRLMAATVLVKRWTGAPAPTGTDITSGTTRLKQADNGTADANNPVPAVTTSYSFWASFRLDCTVTPSNTINNLKWYSDGVSAGTGLTYVGADASTGADSGYRQATSAIELEDVTNHTGIDVPVVNVTTLTSGAPRTLGGSITNPTTGPFGDYWVAQLQVTAAASPGTVAARTWTFQYDET